MLQSVTNFSAIAGRYRLDAWRIHAIVNVGARHPQMTGGDEKVRDLPCCAPVVTIIKRHGHTGKRASRLLQTGKR